MKISFIKNFIKFNVFSNHYYAKLKTNDVVKLVDYGNRYEIHVLKEVNGQFRLTERINCLSKDKGLERLNEMGHSVFSIIRMNYTDYTFRDGVIGFYDIDGTFKSIILNYPPGEHDAIANLLDLSEQNVLRTPYNVYLAKNGKLRTYTIPS